MSVKVEAVVGNTTNRPPIETGDKKLPNRKRTRTVAVYNEETGEMEFLTADQAQRLGIDTTQFPHMSPQEAERVYAKTDSGEGGYRKAAYGSSTRHIDTDEDVRKRGGDPNAKVPKPDSSFSLTRNWQGSKNT